MAWLLRKLDVKTTCLLAGDSPAPRVYNFLSDYEFVNAKDYTGSPDLFIIVDASTKDRLGAGTEVLARAKSSIMIDHHPQPEMVTDAYFGDSEAASTTLLIWDIACASGLELDLQFAIYCYVGLVTDTGRFSYQNTSAHAFAAAAQMVKMGVDVASIYSDIYENRTPGSLKLEARLIERFQTLNNGRLIYSWVNEADFAELEVTRDDTESLPGILRSVSGSDVACLMREEDGGVRVNLRSKGKFDVGAVARSYNGGGHAAAAGITLDMSLDQALREFIPQLSKLYSA
jgi:phosphoesterase RecJ-like protein